MRVRDWSCPFAMDEKPTRRVHCALCKNHKILNKLKGHKGKCQYEDCQCSHCYLVRDRRIIMSKQQSLRRRLEFESKEKPKTEQQKYWLEYMEKDPNNFPGLFLCGACHNEFKTSEMLLMHIQKMHKHIFKQYDDPIIIKESESSESSNSSFLDIGNRNEPNVLIPVYNSWESEFDYISPKKRWKDLHLEKKSTGDIYCNPSESSDFQTTEDFETFTANPDAKWEKYNSESAGRKCNQVVYSPPAYVRSSQIIRPWEHFGTQQLPIREIYETTN